MYKHGDLGISTVSPKWSDFVLTSDIPDSKADVLVFYGFNVESYQRLV